MPITTMDSLTRVTAVLAISFAFTLGCDVSDDTAFPVAIDLESQSADRPAGEPFAAVDDRPFLDSVLGHWRGRCDIIHPGSPGAAQQIEMERIVQPTGDPTRYSWQIIYRTPDWEQLRDYSLIVVDEARGHYQIDENNGIVIDLYYYTPGVATQLFDVGNVRIVAHETIRDKQINLQLISTGLQPATTSAAGQFTVNAYPFNTNQYCTLSAQ